MINAGVDALDLTKSRIDRMHVPFILPCVFNIATENSMVADLTAVALYIQFGIVLLASRKIPSRLAWLDASSYPLLWLMPIRFREAPLLNTHNNENE